MHRRFSLRQLSASASFPCHFTMNRPAASATPRRHSLPFVRIAALCHNAVSYSHSEEQRRCFGRPLGRPVGIGASCFLAGLIPDFLHRSPSRTSPGVLFGRSFVRPLYDTPSPTSPAHRRDADFGWSSRRSALFTLVRCLAVVEHGMVGALSAMGGNGS